MSTINIQKQIEYWKSGSIEAIETAELLIQKGKYSFGLFFCHLSVEKAFKAHFVRCTQNLAPKTHDLYYLLSKCDFTLTDKHYNLLNILMRYQLEGRYPEFRPSLPQTEIINDYLISTKELIEWLIREFSK